MDTSHEAPLDASNLAERFAQLQRRLPALWQEIGRTDPGGALQEDNTIVVIPSLSVDVEVPSVKLQAYEERMLFMLFLLRQPRIRIVYVTSQPIDPAIVDYYLGLIPGVVSDSARRRLRLFSPHDGSRRPLSRKLLDRPRLLEAIRDCIPDPDRAHIVPFNTTDLERELAVRLGIPMYAADPRYLAFGTKSGGRQVFQEEGVPHPYGAEDLYSEAAIVDAIMDLRAASPHASRAVVKLNEGVSGMGNAIVELAWLPPSGAGNEHAAVIAAVRDMKFELDTVAYEWYMAQVEAAGAIVEEFISGTAYHSPSAQLRATPTGEVELLSTHDQMLGGPSGQSYLGAIFPANPAYSGIIMDEAAKIGRRLAREGVVGRFAVDFVVVQSESGAWQPYAIEVNLRKGGTTAPFLILQYLTDGAYDADTGVFRTRSGAERCYVSSDHVEAAAYRSFTPADLFDILSAHRLHYDHATQSGVVLHMVSGVGGFGQCGATVIAASPEAADALYREFLTVLDREAARRTG